VICALQAAEPLLYGGTQEGASRLDSYETIMKIVAVGFLSLGMALLAGACGGSAVESACQAVCDCAGSCTDAELDECIQEVENELKQADDAGCGAEYEDLIDCAVSNAECKDGELDSSVLETACTQEAIDAFTCLGEAGVDN
jgi:hypothetical protein